MISRMHRISPLCCAVLLGLSGVTALRAQSEDSSQSAQSGQAAPSSQSGSQVQPAAPVKNEAVAPQEPSSVTVSKPANQDPLAASRVSFPDVAPSPAMPQGQTLAVSGDYILRPGDTIEMIIYKENDLSIRSRIGKDGKVQLPLLGVVKLSGLSVTQATEFLRARYDADYIVSPQIYLNILAYSTVKFTIIGQVNKPGAYEYAESEPLDLLQAIGMAGGFTRIADRGHVRVKRREGNAVKTIKVNAKKLTDSNVDRFMVETGDVIDVGESWY